MLWVKGRGGPGTQLRKTWTERNRKTHPLWQTGLFFPPHRQIQVSKVATWRWREGKWTVIAIISPWLAWARGCRLQTFLFFPCHPGSSRPESSRTSGCRVQRTAGGEHRTQMPSLRAERLGQRGREVPLGRRAAHRGRTVTLRRIFNSQFVGKKERHFPFFRLANPPLRQCH